MHSTLTRLLKRLGLNEGLLPSNLESWQLFVAKIGKLLEDYDQERYLSERSLKLSSQELMQLNEELERKVDEKTLVILNQKAEIEATSRFAALGEMAGGIGHEINNPLMIIDAQIYKLKGQIAAGRLTPEQFEKGLSLIELTTDRIARIVRGLKSLSRNSEHDPVESVVLSRLVAETIDLCEQRFASKDIRLTVSKECDPGLEVVVRPSQLGQVLLNLLNNAYDAVENLSEKWVNLAYTAQESHCVIRITDSGSGIPSVILEKIMQPFFTTKEVGKGTGLGLSISKKIIEDHGGKFSYDPNSPHTSFVIELPLTK